MHERKTEDVYFYKYNSFKYNKNNNSIIINDSNIHILYTRVLDYYK